MAFLLLLLFFFSTLLFLVFMFLFLSLSTFWSFVVSDSFMRTNISSLTSVLGFYLAGESVASRGLGRSSDADVEAADHFGASFA